MKNLYSTGLLSLLLFTAQLVNAQVDPPLNQPIPDKPCLFASLPDKFECNLPELEKLFSSATPQKIFLKLNAVLLLDGVLSEKFVRSTQLSSLMIRLNNYSDALFNLSRINENGNIYYTGRIASISHGDLLLLKKENDKYFFIKQQQRFSIVE